MAGENAIIRIMTFAMALIILGLALLPLLTTMIDAGQAIPSFSMNLYTNPLFNAILILIGLALFKILLTRPPSYEEQASQQMASARLQQIRRF